MKPNSVVRCLPASVASTLGCQLLSNRKSDFGSPVHSNIIILLWLLCLLLLFKYSGRYCVPSWGSFERG